MARRFPRNLLEFETRFRTKEACLEYFDRIRWAQGFRCPRCFAEKAWRVADGSRQCWKCSTRVSRTAGTIFHRSHLPLHLWFRAIWWFTNQKTGLSALGLQRALGLGSYRTAWLCLHKLRSAMVRPNRDRLGGAVEVDETIVGGRKKGAIGRSPGFNALVVIAVEIRRKGMGRIRLQRIPAATRRELVGFIKRAVVEGSTVVTDGWRAYEALEPVYLHRRHVTEGPDGTNSAVLPRVHRVASLLKRWLLGTHQGRVSPEHLDAYLEEFAFRFNRRTSPHRGQLFYRLIQQACGVEPLPYKKLVKPKQRALMRLT